MDEDTRFLIKVVTAVIAIVGSSATIVSTADVVTHALKFGGCG